MINLANRLMVFEKKKIQIETLGEYLVSVRQNLKLSIEEVSRQTGITQKFLEALESGYFNSMPADVYVLGFLKQLSQVYAVDLSELAEQYKKEKGIQKQLQNRSNSLAFTWQRKIFNKLIITPKVLSLSLGMAFIVLTVGYIIWQVWSINKTPSLQISQPLNNSIIAGAAVTVQGQTDPGIAISVNDQNIFVDSQGSFQTQISLSPGPKDIVVQAKNRFDKTVSKTINITGIQPQKDSSNPLELKIDFSAPVSLGFTIDGQAMQTLGFNQGDSKTFIATQKIILSTSDAGATRITLNGQSLGAMGRPKESLADVPFFAQSANINNNH